ncbi:VOC family protein [Leucobacter denitrificans]|uniref:VOC family protein n=1 Tax=Leucobacter denitrificans TaxID=683042 RepID=A0A7G9S382_9MICO|nr:VOC family protein [Leucobacter denitrificans]QNN62307.1 VOC family protein [Leucobacter denitrificans]
MTAYLTTRAGFIITAKDVSALAKFYVEGFDFELTTMFEDPPYAILVKEGMRLSLTEDGTRGDDIPEFTFSLDTNRDARSTCMVLEVDSCDAARAELESRGVTMRSETFRPPWGGARFFCEDPEHNLIEIEELA